MLIKEATYKECEKCGRRIDQETAEIYGCDECKTVIDLNDPKYQNRVSPYLEITIFYKDKNIEDRGERIIFCSWRCTFNYLLKLKDRTDIDFISLPSLDYERDINDHYRGDLFKCIK